MSQLDDLRTQVRNRSKEIASEALSMSIGELLSMYERGDLDIHPEFQRFYRWTDEKKARLVESILLGIPVPPIFVAQTADYRWEVVDGLQRLSAIFETMGALKDEKMSSRESLRLPGTRHLPALAGTTWDGRDGTLALPEDLKRRFRLSRLDIRVVLDKSAPDAKYELFDRLNTGGSLATDQEVRNCLVIMKSRDVFRWMKSLSEYEPFIQSLPLTDRKEEEQFRMELLTRFVVLRRLSLPELAKHDDLGSFLTQKVLERIDSQTLPSEDDRREFEALFRCLSEQLGENAFRRYDEGKGRHVGGVLVSLFETLAIGLGYAFRGSVFEHEPDRIVDFQKGLWSDNEYRRRIGPGVSTIQRIPFTVEHGRKVVRGDAA